MAKKDKQILAALARVRQEAGAGGELFEFYEGLLKAISAKKATLSLSAEELLKLKEGKVLPHASEPYLSWEALAIGDELYPWLLSIANLFDRRDPGALDEVEAVEKEKCVALGQVWFEEGTTSLGPTVDALFTNALAPYLERAAELMMPHLPLNRWKQTYCPVCGGFPDIALRNERRGTQKLMCERCRAEWRVADEGCFFCGEHDPELYGFYSSEDDLYRVMTCDSCGYYLKIINLWEARRIKFKPILAAERILTPGLDLLAAQEGYTRPLEIVAFGKD